jgi:hypothetical protein
MALALGYAYNSKKGFDAEEIGANFLKWWIDGWYGRVYLNEDGCRCLK